jgi:type I restriction enzyme M protein
MRELVDYSDLSHGLSGGADAVPHILRAAVASNPTHIVAQMDFKNAFNSIARVFVIQLILQIAALGPYIALMYASPTNVFYNVGAVVLWVCTDVGVTQGCPLGGFLFSAHQHVVDRHPNLTKDEKKHLKESAFVGFELVQATARVCAMNMLLHGIGSEKSVPVRVGDALGSDPGERFEVVLANPPFGKKSSTVIVGEDGRTSTEKDTIERDDFWATTSNKQLNFVQHIKTLLAIHGRAAVVLPDNVLFEGGAGETIRKKLLHECDLHTLLRLPTGLFYAQGVKANVLFFDKKPASESPWTKKLWIYDLRTNKHFTLKTNPLRRADLDEFVDLYKVGQRHQRTETWSLENPDGRWRAYGYDELIARDKTSLDIFWLKDDSLADSDNLPAPAVIAQEIVEDLQAALEQFKLIASDLEASSGLAQASAWPSQPDGVPPQARQA